MVFFRWLLALEVWVRRLFVLSSLLAVIGAILFYIPTDYFITAPGAAIDTSRLIEVKGGERHRGRIYMLVLNTQPANLFWYLYAKLDSRAVLETRQEYLGDLPSYADYVDWNKQLMENSQRTARAIALQQLGYGQGVRSIGVRVVAVLNTSPARDRVKAGDLLLAIDGEPVTSTEALRAILRERIPGERLTLTLRRGGESLLLVVPTMENPDPSRAGTAALGVQIANELHFDDGAVPVTIQAGPIFGPSAGMMFTLQIIDQLTPGGLVKDLVVAGTGTIEPDGRVGVIGGVQQKVYTAEAAGAQVMFVPRGNWDEAKLAATRVELVPVDHIRDALLFIRRYHEERASLQALSGVSIAHLAPVA